MSAPPPNRRRFVVQAHDAPPLHYDLMLEWGRVLSTWGLGQPPERSAGPQPAEAKPDHRRAYLEFEGEIAGGRGSCRIWDRGEYEAWVGPGETLHLTMHGERMHGFFRLERSEGGWMLHPTDAVPAGAKMVTSTRTPMSGRRRRGDRRSGRRAPLIVRVMLVAAVVVLVGGITYGVAIRHYHQAYRDQVYQRILAVYQLLLEEKDELRGVKRIERLERRVIGSRVTVIGRVGAVEPATRSETHPDGKAVFLWVDVPNDLELANSTPLDVRCTITHADLDIESDPDEPGHRHRWERGDLVIVEGILVKFLVDRVAAHATVVIKDAHARDPSAIEAHMYGDEATSLGVLEPLKGISDPLRGTRDDDQRPK